MDLLSVEFWTALLSIIIIDLLLAGDNAIVIGLAARNLPKHQLKKGRCLGDGRRCRHPGVGDDLCRLAAENPRAFACRRRAACLDRL